MIYMCVCVSVERERERKREWEGEREGERERKRERKKENPHRSQFGCFEGYDRRMRRCYLDCESIRHAVGEHV